MRLFWSCGMAVECVINVLFSHEVMTASLFTNVFLVLLGVSFAFATWLTFRHMRHVAAHRATVPAEFAEAITIDAHRKAANYTLDRQRLGLIESAIDVSVLLALTIGGGLAFLHAAASGWFANTYVVGLVFIALLSVVTGFIGLPFDLIRTFGIEAKYGFNKITPKLFIGDMLKGWVLSAAIGVPLLLATFWLMEKMGTLWWLYVWLVWTGFSLAMIAIYPNFIAPFFNKFQPLENESLKTRVEALLAKCGFQSKGLFVMDGSKRSSHGNAYFTGLGNSKRIVFFDTLIERLTPTEIEAVLAHELGHFKRKHIAKRMVSTFAISFVILALMGWVIDKPWFYNGLGFPSEATPHVAVSLVLFFTVLPVFTFWMTPLSSLISRKHEFEADAYAASQSDANALVTALVKLYRDNASTLTPDPLHSAVYDSHPPASIRIAHLRSLQTQT
jgi:STE24 endopeptidase